MNQHEMGLYGKFEVRRLDGTDAPGGKHEHSEYFVLDLTCDPFARCALATYALACAKEYPKLAEDLWTQLGLGSIKFFWVDGEEVYAAHSEAELRQWLTDVIGYESLDGSIHISEAPPDLDVLGKSQTLIDLLKAIYAEPTPTIELPLLLTYAYD